MPTYRYAFISHAHMDNALCDPYSTALARLGVPHYYDRENPQVGHSLSLALQQEIERAGALIVMVSPASIASFWVNEEINMFFALMAEDRSRKLIPVKIAPCELPPRLKSRWWLDATTLSRDDVVAQLARALEGSATPAASHTASGAFSRIVDWRHGMGDHTTITDAIAAARPGERILVRKGIYDGGLVIDKPLEIVGDGQPGDVEVRTSGADVILFKATQGRVANLTIRQTGGGAWDGVDIAAGRLDLEDCDISSQGRVGIAIHNGANPRVRRCHIHGNKGSGVFVYEQGQGLIEDCDTTTNALAGVSIRTGGAPTVRQCRIHDNTENGVLVYEQGQGLIADCDIARNAYSGVEVREGSAPTVRHCRIHDNEQSGVFVHKQSQGLIEDCDIIANTRAGVEVKSGSAPTARQCRINRNSYEAIWVRDQSGGVYEQNDLRDNKRGAWDIADDSEEKVTRRGNTE